MSVMRIGFAGFRHNHIFGLYQTAEASPDAEIAAAWEEDAEARNAAMQKGVSFNCETFDELLRDHNVDIVAIGDYYGRRGELVIRALRAGKHVIADKPLCTSLAELNEIRRLSKQNGLKVGMMLDLRYNKNILAAKKLIEEGKIGEINNIYFGGQHPLLYGERPHWYFEDGKHGGTINDISIHAIDIVKNYLHLDLKTVCAARTWNKLAEQEPQFRDSAQMMLELSNGAGLLADVSYTLPNAVGFALPYYWEFRIWGTEGMLAFSLDSDHVSLYLKNEKDGIPCDGIPCDRNWLTDLIRDINGLENFTDGILASTEDVLTIQAFADQQ